MRASPSVEPVRPAREIGAGQALAAVTLIAAALLLPRLDAIDLWAPDEPRYAQVADELRRSVHVPADWILLHVNGEVYTQKPPLYFWLAALCGAPGGHVDEVAARLPSALAGIAVALLTAWLGRQLTGRWTPGVLAALVLLTLPRFAHQARRAQLDVLLTLFELGALVAYGQVDAHPERTGPARTRLVAIFHAAVALALLTKGPVGALPWLVVVVHRALGRRLSSLRSVFPAWGVALAIAPVAAWAFAAIALAAPGYGHEAIVDNLFARFFVGTDHVRPFYYFAYQLPLDLLPWTPVMVVGALTFWRERSHSPESARVAQLLLAWTLCFVLFFSLSVGKRGLYMLPLFPALSVLAGRELARWLDAERLPSAYFATSAGLLLGIALLGAWLGLGAPGLETLPAAVHDSLAIAWSMALVASAGAGSLAWAARSRSRVVVGLAIPFASLLLLETILFQSVYPTLDPLKSPRPIAAVVARATATDERVGVFRHSAFTGGLEYYAARLVVRLESAHEIDGFVGSGAHILVVRESDVSAATAGRSYRVLDAVRNGSRRLLVIELLERPSNAHPGETEAADLQRRATPPNAPATGDPVVHGIR